MERNIRLMSVAGIVLAVIALILAGYTLGQQSSLLNRLSTLESQVAAVEQVQAETQELDGVPREDFDQLADQVGALIQQVSELEADIGGDAPDLPTPAEDGEAEQDEDAATDGAEAEETDNEAPAE